MTHGKAPLALLLLLVLSALVLPACGGGDDEGSDETTSAASVEHPDAGVPPQGEEGEPGGGSSNEDGAGDRSSSEGSDPGKGEGAAKPAKTDGPASLETNPRSIRGAIVTSTGAVQTLPVSEQAHEEAVDNSYSSIKAFGGEAEGAEATDITFALVQYLNAKASGDWDTACARLYSVIRDKIAAGAEKSDDPAVKGGGCPAAYGALMKRASRAASVEAAKIDVASIRRGEDNRAFVIYKTPDTLSADMPMYLDGGVWTVGAVQAYVLTPELAQEGQE